MILLIASLLVLVLLVLPNGFEMFCVWVATTLLVLALRDDDDDDGFAA